MINTLYLYDNEIQLLFDNQTLCKRNDNRPMNNLPIKIHKGVENQIKFRVYDPDRKPQNVQHLSIRAALISTDSSERVLEKMCVVTTEKGTFSLHVTESELVNMAPGFYNLVVTSQEPFVAQTPGEVLSAPFYSDTYGNVVSSVEVLNAADATPIPTTELLGSSFTENNQFDGLRTFVSSAVPASRVANSINGLHTLAIYAENFTGKVFLKGTLDNTPSTLLTEYFDIAITSLKDVIDYDEYTGIDPVAFSANFMWIKVVYQYNESENDGKINKILIRT